MDQRENIRQIRKLKIEIENGTNQIEAFGKNFLIKEVSEKIQNLFLERQKLTELYVIF